MLKKHVMLTPPPPSHLGMHITFLLGCLSDLSALFYTVSFVERIYTLFLVNFVKAPQPDLQASVDAHQKKILGPSRAVPSRQTAEIASRSPLAEMAARWRCGPLIKNRTTHSIVSLVSA